MVEMQMNDIILYGNGSAEDEADSSGVFRFEKSLQELRDLRSQLYFAADYCEKSFSKPNAKKLVVENTKEYICRALVTVVDHLGSVSTNLEFRLSKSNVIPEAELRIDCLKQRLLACEIYAHKLDLTKLCFREDLPRHHSQYIAPSLQNLENSDDISSSEDDYMQPLLSTYTHKLPSATVRPSGFDFSTLVPLQNVPSISWKPQSPFHFQVTQKFRQKERTRKSLRLSSDFSFLLRRSKRAL